jgi:hypothetical protein
MLGQSNIDGQQAYSGEQLYKFSLDDEWSPRLERDREPNQQLNVKIIGSPKWYFWVREFWRRVYIQPWEDPGNVDDGEFVGKKGIRYDASRDMHTWGPFREGKGNFFYWTNTARTLPIEYYHDENRTIRDHFIRSDDTESEWNRKWSYDASVFENVSDTGVDPSGYNSTRWIIPRSIYAGRPSNNYGGGDGPSADNRAREYGYADSNYIHPTIEYQYVQQMNWERPEGWEERPDGDGFEREVSIPFKLGGKIQSPFSDDQLNVSAPGTYHHGFELKHPENILKYAENSLIRNGQSGGDPDNIYVDPNEWDLPASGVPISFHVPAGMSEDGKWVEQCLGAIVKARALVTLEDNFGRQYSVWVNSSQYMVQDNFEGSDQNAGE